MLDIILILCLINTAMNIGIAVILWHHGVIVTGGWPHPKPKPQSQRWKIGS